MTPLLRFLKKPWHWFWSWRCKNDPLFFSIWIWAIHLVHQKKLTLVKRTGAMGDIIALLPLLEEIRKQGELPILLTTPYYTSIFQQSGIEGGVYGIKYDFQIPLWIQNRFKVLIPITTEEKTGNALPCHLQCDLANSVGYKTEPQTLIWNEEIQEQPPIQKKEHEFRIAIHAGPTWKVREWPQQYWEKWAKEISNIPNVKIYQLGATSVYGLPSDSFGCIAHTENYMNRFSMRELIAFIHSCDLYVGIDSGLLHLASSLNRPVIGLFGPTLPEFIMPPSATHQGMHTPDTSCVGCHHQNPIKHWRTGCPLEMQCMKTLDPEVIIKKTRDMIMKENSMIS